MIVNSMLTAASLVLIGEPLLRYIGQRLLKKNSLGIRFRPFLPSIFPSVFSMKRAFLQVVAGFGMSWGFAILGAGYDAVFIFMFSLFFVTFRALPDAEKNAGPDDIVFFDALADRIEDGSDFFEAMALATDVLKPGENQNAVRRTLSRFAERRSLADCLEPLTLAGEFYSGLAADVQRTGWESSATLQLSARQMQARVKASWGRKHRQRVLMRGLEKTQAVLYYFCWGMAGFNLVFQPGLYQPWFWWILTALFFVLMRSFLLSRRRFIAWLSISIFLLLLWGGAQTNFAAPGASSDADSWLRAAPQFIRKMPAPVVQKYCTVSTGFEPGWVRLRSGPSMLASTEGFVEEGEPLQMLSPQSNDSLTGEWWFVRTNAGLHGWIYRPLCELNNDQP